jgi:uroporphyrin-III C-methyltransferase/precorrin-2 dehydrogenase/sirohydrochlorin ferrochelatase
MSIHENPSHLVPDLQSRAKGRISLVGAGPGAVDLMTVRAIRCLGGADVVFYDRLVDPEALSFVRPGVACVFVGKEVGAHSWPQDRINAVIVAAALQGKHVVRLKSGDPSIFGRASEEIAAARANGIEVDIIPGVTAASAAAASLCEPLTTRGVTDRVVLATATCRPGDAPSDLSEIARPGTTLVFYMAMKQLADLTTQLLTAGVQADQPVTIAANISRPDCRTLRTHLTSMEKDCAAARLENPAVIVVHLAKATGSTVPPIEMTLPVRQVGSSCLDG